MQTTLGAMTVGDVGGTAAYREAVSSAGACTGALKVGCHGEVEPEKCYAVAGDGEKSEDGLSASDWQAFIS